MQSLCSSIIHSPCCTPSFLNEAFEVEVYMDLINSVLTDSSSPRYNQALQSPHETNLKGKDQNFYIKQFTPESYQTILSVKANKPTPTFYRLTKAGWKSPTDQFLGLEDWPLKY